MKVTPVRRYEEPAYPTNTDLSEDPGLLKHVPARWRANPLVLTALGWVVSLGLSVRAEAAESKKPSATPAAKASKPVRKPAAQAGVAPLFEHGDGRGTFGCVAVASPVFLSEEEARQVINAEAKKAGLTFKSPGPEVRMSVPLTEVSGKQYDEQEGIYSRTSSNWGMRPAAPLAIDGADTRRSIGYVFVSDRDFDNWERPSKGLQATATSSDIKGAAKRLAQGLKKSPPPMAIGVFYDPVATYSWEDFRGGKKADAIEVDVHAKATQMLRQQVRDFIGWLKAQGVI